MSEQILPKAKKSVALSGTAAGNTAICTVGRTGNDLNYRGYDIKDLARTCEFEEVAHLIIHGKLPNQTELEAYKLKLKSLRGLPDGVLAQLGNRIQHALRAYTPSERKGVKAAAQSFRENPAFDSEEVITDLGVGEALVSTLDEKGAPGIVQRTLIRPPSSRLGPATEAERKAEMKNSPVLGLYDEAIDRESAYEILLKREEDAAAAAEKLAKEELKAQKELEKKKARQKKKTTSRRRSTRMTTTERAINTASRTIARRVTDYVLRGILGSRRR